MGPHEGLELHLIGREDILSIVPLYRQRNQALSEALLKQRVSEMAEQGFQCLGAYLKGKLVGVAGFWIKTRYHTGKLIEPDGVFVEESHRSKGIGDQLMKWIYDFGKKQGCLGTELHCYVTNGDAHRFWMNQGYEIIAFHFSKDL